MVSRHLRPNGPFTAADTASALHLSMAVVESVLAGLERSGRLAPGAFRPEGPGREWVDELEFNLRLSFFIIFRLSY